MHLLFVTSLVPDGEPTTGYEIANQSIVDALRRNGVKVTSLGFNWVNRTPRDIHDTIILGEVDVRSESAGPADKAKWVATAFANSLTISSAKLRIVTEEQIRSAINKAEPFDGYVINGVTIAGAFQNLFKDKPSLYVAHNVEYLSAEENAVTANSGLKRYFFRREAKLLRDLELSLTARAACTFALAEEDRAPLNVSASDRSVVMPLIIKREPTEMMPERHIVFDAGLIGTWTWQPNRVGLEWFLREVVPHLPADFSIAVAGQVPSGFHAMPRQVKVLGRVQSAVEFVRSCAVIPLVSQSGTGVQLKSIETFELGLPSVATNRSLRGISDIPQNCVRLDDPKLFAKALVDLARSVRDGDLRDQNGYEFHARQIERQDKAVKAALGLMSLQLSATSRKAA